MASNSVRGGYDVEFVGNEPNHVTCCICLLVLREPMQAEKCGHRFCKLCVEEIRKSGNGNPICPEDRSEMHLFSDKGKQREILDFVVKCSNSKDGCSWTQELRQFDEHLLTCDFETTNCSNEECTDTMQRKSLVIHMEEECIYRKVDCRHCSNSYVFFYEKVHMDVCTEFPLRCEHCEEKVARSRMDEHFLKDCIKIPRPCEFSNIGCNKKIDLESFEHHQETALKEHLKLALNTICVQKEEISLLKLSQVRILERLERIESKECSLSIFNDVFDWSFKKSEILESHTDRHIEKSFYTSQYHNLQVQVSLNYLKRSIGIFAGSNQGSYDGSLEWPIKATVHFSIWNDQKCFKQMSLDTTEENHLDYFGKSSKYDPNNFIGYSEFISYNEIILNCTSTDLTIRVQLEYH